MGIGVTPCWASWIGWRGSRMSQVRTWKSAPGWLDGTSGTVNRMPLW
jgi:hypothetical protein